MDDLSNSTLLTKEDQQKDVTPLTKEEQEKDVKQIDAKIEAGISGTTERATEPESEKETAETADEEISRKPLGKRAGKPNTTDSKKKKEDLIKNQDVTEAAPSKSGGEKAFKKEQKLELPRKKKKIESKNQDGAFPTPFNGEVKLSEKKDEQEQHAFNVPRTPPGTFKAPIPATPIGKPPQSMNPKYTPSRPKGTPRLIKW